MLCFTNGQFMWPGVSVGHTQHASLSGISGGDGWGGGSSSLRVELRTLSLRPLLLRVSAAGSAGMVVGSQLQQRLVDSAAQVSNWRSAQGAGGGGRAKATAAGEHKETATSAEADHKFAWLPAAHAMKRGSAQAALLPRLASIARVRGVQLDGSLKALRSTTSEAATDSRVRMQHDAYDPLKSMASSSSRKNKGAPLSTLQKFDFGHRNVLATMILPLRDYRSDGNPTGDLAAHRFVFFPTPSAAAAAAAGAVHSSTAEMDAAASLACDQPPAAAANGGAAAATAAAPNTALVESVPLHSLLLLYNLLPDGGIDRSAVHGACPRPPLPTAAGAQQHTGSNADTAALLAVHAHVWSKSHKLHDSVFDIIGGWPLVLGVLAGVGVWAVVILMWVKMLGKNGP
jgi:hypothetical protein